MNTFIVNPTTRTIVALVASLENFELGANYAVSKAEDLESWTNAQLADLYNNITGESKKAFKTAKAESTYKVFDAMEKADLSALIQLAPPEVKKVEEVAVAVAVVAGERKVRDSKLQRMAAAFREMDGDVYHQWTIKALMEKCGTTEKITHQYISILRAKNDRFVMNITKNKEANTFVYAPAPVAVAA